jgi:hypothetical protein
VTRILFVDDDRLVLDALRNSLRKQRRVWDMHFTPEGEHALAMPRVDGLEVLLAAKVQRPRAVASGGAS